METVTYRIGNELDLDAVIELYNKSTLGERRPVHSRKIMGDMIRHADLVVTAWDGDKLVGIARTLTDFSYVAYLADLAVHADYQRLGIGRALLEHTRKNLEDSCFITLLAAPMADDYYGKVGFERNPRAWVSPNSGSPSIEGS
ncbi:MAG: GNAT family N-acetyltransferase [Puniceicoccaceae bacterium]